jgi:N-acyl homoserine lactone hydrolase
MKMHILSGGRLRIRKSIYFPDADRGETIEMPVSSILLRDARGNVLFDTGCHPSVAQDATARWGGLTKLMQPIMGPDDNVIAGLAALGLEPGDIDVVVCSHLHPDHCGCNAFFIKATVMGHALELEAARAAITGERDLYDDGRVVLIPLPGHTPGMLGALVALERAGSVPARFRYGEPARHPRHRHPAEEHVECRRADQILGRSAAHRSKRRHRHLRP